MQIKSVRGGFLAICCHTRYAKYDKGIAGPVASSRLINHRNSLLESLTMADHSNATKLVLKSLVEGGNGVGDGVGVC
jgi:hypothetical protein